MQSKKAKKTGCLSRKNGRCPYKDFIVPGLIDGSNVEMLLDSGCDMTLVHSDLVDPEKVNHKEKTHLHAFPITNQSTLLLR